MDWFRRIVTDRNPYQRYAIVAIAAGCLFFTAYLHEPWSHAIVAGLNHAIVAIAAGSFDIMHTLIQILVNNKELCLICVYLIIFLYFFGKNIEPSYSNFIRCYIAWILVATLYHLPILQSMGVDMRMYLSLFFTIYISTILFLFVFHISFSGLWYIGIFARVAGKKLEVWTIIKNCTVISVACCVFYSHCGDRAILKEKSLEWRPSELKDRICSSGGISPIYSFWGIIISLYVVVWFIRALWLTHPAVALADQEYDGQQMKPDFLDMVPWYSGTSTDLFKTVFDLLVSVTIFLGRFDMRMFEAAKFEDQDRIHDRHLFYGQFSDKKDLWFDFMADTGDGGSSSYAVAQLLAQPSIDNLEYCGDSVGDLQRGDLLLIGGDLAYPNPSTVTYERRFFRPFEAALQPPPFYRPEHITVNKQESRYGFSAKKKDNGPQCFIIPGNHDWFDGLNTFMRYICHKSWLGGWFLPQKKSYFALKLPQRWWVFGLDQALHGDIDAFQFKYFAELIRSQVFGKNDSVIIMTHEPNWLSDWYWNEVTGKNVSHLIKYHLRGRCKLRMAGDLHHYMRHSYVQSENPAYVPHLLVNGCGGAFLHPTHVFKKFNESNGTTYQNKAAYPSFEDSYKIAHGNIFKFRKKNWQFDFIGGIIYFILVSSLFPQCKLDHILQNDSFSGFLKSYFGGVWHAFMYVLEQSYTSLAGTLLLLIAAFLFVPSKESRKSRAVIGFLHVSAHVVSALILMLALELGIEWFIRNRLLATSGYHTLYEWYRSVQSKHFPDPTGFRTRIERWTFGLYPACLKYLMSAFDFPEVMAVTRNNICKHGIQSLPRGSAIIYYASVFTYFWVFSTPVVSMVFGIYLYLCINWLHIHFDEAFSSLRIADYKAFTRFHITPAGDLEVFTLAVDMVPQDWKLDPEWVRESRPPYNPSHHRKYPSKWTAYISEHNPLDTVRIVDHFTIYHNEGHPNLNNNNNNEGHLRLWGRVLRFFRGKANN